MTLKTRRIYRVDEVIPEMEYIQRISFYLHDVKMWDECMDDDFENREKKTYVYFDGKTIVILMSYDRFDKLMDEFRHQALFGRPITFKFADN